MHTTTWSETDALYAERKPVQSLAELMLANHAELAEQVAHVAPTTVEQVVTAAGVVAEAEAIVAEAAACTCASGSCARANFWTPCTCHCLGAGHGAASRLAYQAGLAKAATRREELYGDNAFGGLPVVDLDEPPVTVTASRPFNPNPIIIDGEKW